MFEGFLSLHEHMAGLQIVACGPGPEKPPATRRRVDGCPISDGKVGVFF